MYALLIKLFNLIDESKFEEIHKVNEILELIKFNFSFNTSLNVESMH